MGRWTPLILMGGGLAILLGTLLGINFPMGGGQQTASNNTPTGRTSRVLPANINVNSTAPSRGSRASSEDSAATSTPQEDNTPTEATETEARGTEARGTRSLRQENLNTTRSERRTSVAQNTTPNESFSTPDNTSGTNTQQVQSTDSQSTDTSTSNDESDRTPIRALW